MKFSRTFGATLIAALLASLQAGTALAALPTSGTCGFLVTLPHPEVNWQIANGVSTGTTRTTDILGSIDFASRTISYNITTLYYDGSSWQYGSANGSSTFTIGNHLANPSGAYPIQFAVSATGSASLGSYISGSVTVSYQTILNLLPTNSGNTVLIQGGNNKISGVCQMM